MTATVLHTGAASTSSERKVRGSSFYMALRILPAAQRVAMFEIYGFCRDVDDIADDGGPRDQRHAALLQWRADIAALYQGRITPRTHGLAGPVQQFGLQCSDFLAIIDGMDMDVAEDIRAPDMAMLDLYCDRVASAVGRLSVRVFGMAQADGIELAHHLGRALQLTNILRDVDEDAAIGRLYLPRAALLAAGIAATEPGDVMRDARLAAACAPLVVQARQHFARARAIMAGSPRSVIRTPMLMWAAYGSILAGLERRGFALPRQRVRIGKFRMLGLLLRYGLL